MFLFLTFFSCFFEKTCPKWAWCLHIFLSSFLSQLPHVSYMLLFLFFNTNIIFSHTDFITFFFIPIFFSQMFFIQILLFYTPFFCIFRPFFCVCIIHILLFSSPARYWCDVLAMKYYYVKKRMSQIICTHIFYYSTFFFFYKKCNLNLLIDFFTFSGEFHNGSE